MYRITKGIMQSARLIFFLLCGTTLTFGEDVVIGILGNSVSIVCKLPISDTLAWDTVGGDAIAMYGTAVNSTDTKHVIERQNGVRESLVIHNLSLADDNVFRCYDLRATDVKLITKLNVLVRPEHMNLSAPTRPVLEGTVATLVCETNGGKPLPIIQWYMKGVDGVVTELTGTVRDHLYRNGTGHRTSVLRTNVTRSLFRAEFVCNVSVAAFYRKTLTLVLDVHLKPLQPRILGYTGSYDINSLLKLECITNGSVPMATVSWMLDGLPVRNIESAIILEQNGTFTTSSSFEGIMTRDQNGSVLTCAVSNAALQERGILPVMTNITLFASSRPILTLDQSSYTAREGHNVTLRCHINARPFPNPDSVVWLHDGQTVSTGVQTWSTDSSDGQTVSTGVQTLSTDSRLATLTMQHVMRSNAGNYSCHASNRLGSGASPQTRLTVLYRPMCTSTPVQKIAARYGHSVRLHCQMHAEPRDVIMTWKYNSQNNPIRTTVAESGTNSTQLVFGAIDLFISSTTQYTTVGCYGNNTEGISLQPCLYQIVRPGPAETPTNCTADALNTTVIVHCEPGFSGGSEQTFMLQRWEKQEFRTTWNDTAPKFTFENHQNVTIRVCAVNAEFNGVASCASPLTVRVEGTHTLEVPVRVTSSQATAYIAGGVTAFIGLVIISAILAVIITRRRKEFLSRRTASKTTTPPNQLYGKPKKSDIWQNPIINRLPERETTRAELGPVSNVTGCEFKTSCQDHHLPPNSSVISTSTPCREQCPEVAFSKHNGIQGAYYLQKKQMFPRILDENTGPAISPIVPHGRDGRGAEATVSYMDDMIVSLSVNTSCSDQGISGCYSAADIDEILDQSEGTHHAATGSTDDLVVKHVNDDIDAVLNAVNNEIIDDNGNNDKDGIKHTDATGVNIGYVDDICDAEVNGMKSDTKTNVVNGTEKGTNIGHVKNELNDCTTVYKQNDSYSGCTYAGDSCHTDRDVCSTEHMTQSGNDTCCLQNDAITDKEDQAVRSMSNGVKARNMLASVHSTLPLAQKEVAKLDGSPTSIERVPVLRITETAHRNKIDEARHKLHGRKYNSFPNRCRKSRDKSINDIARSYDKKMYCSATEIDKSNHEDGKIHQTEALIHAESGMVAPTSVCYGRDVSLYNSSDVTIDSGTGGYNNNSDSGVTIVDATDDITYSGAELSDTKMDFGSSVDNVLHLEYEIDDMEANVLEQIDRSAGDTVVTVVSKKPVPDSEEMSKAKTILTRRDSFMAAVTYEPLDNYLSIVEYETECGHFNRAFEQNERTERSSTGDGSELSATNEKDVDVIAFF